MQVQDLVFSELSKMLRILHIFSKSRSFGIATINFEYDYN